MTGSGSDAVEAGPLRALRGHLPFVKREARVSDTALSSPLLWRGWPAVPKRGILRQARVRERSIDVARYFSSMDQTRIRATAGRDLGQARHSRHRGGGRG